MHLGEARTPLLFSVGLLTLCASWAEPVVVADTLIIGNTVSGPLKIGRRVVALPSGSWQLIAKSDRSLNSDGPSQAVELLDLDFQELRDNRIRRMLHVVATKSSRSTRWLDEPCKVLGDSYWLDDRGRSPNDQFCVRVNFIAAVVDGSRGPQYGTWAKSIKAARTSYSPEMPFVSVTRFTSYDYLRMSVAFDPEISGVKPSSNPARKFNDWGDPAVKGLPQNLKFFDALVAWAPEFADAVQRAFEGDEKLTSVDFGSPSLPGPP